METAYPEPTSGQTQAPGSLGPYELAETSHRGQPSSPKTLRPLPLTRAPITVASGTLQPSLHHHTLLHPLPAGKSPAAGWPLSTGFVLLHEMNCCGVGVGESGCRERSQGSGWLGVPGFAHGDRGEQLAAQLPASLALPPHHRSPPQGWIGLFVLAELWQRWRYRKPHQRRALALSLHHTRWDLSRRLCGARVSPMGGMVCSGRGRQKTPQKPPALASKSLRCDTWCWQTRCPVGSSETKTDFFRGNKYVKAKEKIKAVLGVGEMHRDKALLHQKQVKKKSEALIWSQTSQSETCQ